MKQALLSTACAVIASASLVTVAEAAIVDLNGITVNSSGKTVVATETLGSGETLEIAVEAYGWWFDFAAWDYAFAPTSGLTSYQGGLGIKKSRGDQHTVDGRGEDEAIVITAEVNGQDEAIRLTGVQFSYFGGNADFDLFVEDLSGSISHMINDQNIASNNPALLSNIGTSFAIAADSDNCNFWGCGDHDSFKLRGFSYELLDGIGNEIPLPGALPLMAAGIGIFAARRKRS